MPAQHRIRFDVPLANVASAAMPVDNYVGLQILKPFETKAQSGKLWAFGTDTFFRAAVATGRVGGLVAPGSAYERFEFDVSASDLYSCEKYGLEAVITDEELDAARQQGAPIRNLREMRSALILSHLLSLYEQRSAALLFDTTTTFASYTAAPAAQWDADTADPWVDRITAEESIKGAGMWNRKLCDLVMLMSMATWQRTRRNAALIESIKHTMPAVTSKITPELFASYMEVDKVLIADATYNSSQDDTSITVANIWADNVGFYMVPKNPQNHVGPLLGMTMLYTGVGGSLPYGYMNERYDERNVDGEVVKGRHFTDLVVKDAGCGYVFTDVTAAT